ncbi:MAG: hypothetical protein ABI158_06600, partial [Edaphobacter sp.]
FISSPNLPHAVSSVIHLLLAFGMGFMLVKVIPRESTLARLLSLVLLYILVTPSAVRWLNDGMETGLELCFVAILCLLTFQQSNRRTTTYAQYVGFTILALFTALLRTELVFLCGIAFAILVWKGVLRSERGNDPARWLKLALCSSHLMLGCFLAMVLIFLRMHTLLPDTAIAKAGGSFNLGTFHTAATVLAGALTFGVGLLLLWLLSLFLLFRSGRFSVPALFANIVFPAVLLLAALRGQAIQGARYLVWTYFFSTLWNILELGTVRSDRPLLKQGYSLVYGLIVILLITLPFECKIMYGVLTRRAATMKIFEGQHLDILQGKHGTASDIGYIGYFSRADICDLAGLVNGRAAARLTKDERFTACAASHPDFVFGNINQIKNLSEFMPMGDWQVCSQYDFVNVRTPDTHYLLFPPSTAAASCNAISGSPVYPLRELLAGSRTP